jgi:hypothetical protein
MGKRHLLLFIFVISATTLFGQEDYKYHRSSLYSILLRHENRPFADEILSSFNSIPIPDKFDDHNLSKRVFKAAVLQKSDTTELDDQKPYIDNLLSKNAIGRRLVAKWFNQNKDGLFNCDLLVKRGFYDASAFDIDLSDKTIRGADKIISDASNELISNTYIIVNDIDFYDRRETGKKLSNAATGVTTVVSAIPIIGLFALPAYGANVRLTESVAGFKIRVTSYLYKLDWNDEIEGTFYKNYYTSVPDETKINAFKKEKQLFSLKYIGKHTVYSGITTLRGINRQEEFFIKVCTRALDESVANLQKEHAEFRVKTPLLSIEPLSAKIGMKEGVNEESEYEVLEVLEEDGLTKYKRVGIIKPSKGKVWDNRYLAEFEEENENSTLKATEFEKVSGGDFYPGMLIREITK